MKNNRSRAKILTLIWVCSLYAASACAGIYKLFIPQGKYMEPVTFPWQAQAVTGGLILGYFYPLLFVILHYAKAEKLRSLKMFSYLMIAFLTLVMLIYMYLLILDPYALLW